MRQRAAFLRTILAGGDLLLLDEPFGALDALTRAQLQEWLLGVWERHRRTTLFVTHDVDEAIFLADRVFVMTPRPGRVALDQPVALPRPRDASVLTAPAFVELKARLLAVLRGELPPIAGEETRASIVAADVPAAGWHTVEEVRS